MDGYFRVLAHYLVLLIDVGGGEVDHDVHDEHDVNWKQIKFYQRRRCSGQSCDFFLENQLEFQTNLQVLKTFQILSETKIYLHRIT